MAPLSSIRQAAQGMHVRRPSGWAETGGTGLFSWESRAILRVERYAGKYAALYSG